MIRTFPLSSPLSLFPPLKNSLKNRDARLRRYKSVKKMVELVKVASELAPRIPLEALHLDPFDRISL